MLGERRSNITPCKGMEQDLILYHYGELSAAERAAVETHTHACASCRCYLDQIGSLLPLTVQPDDPPQAFWDDYSRDMRRRLVEKERPCWRQSLAALLRPWAVPALAASAVAVIALTFALGKGFFRPKEISPGEASLMEVLPVAENLEFFSAMDILDTLDLLESMAGPGNGQA